MKQQKGFAIMEKEKAREVQSRGGKTAWERGTAHKWTAEEASRAGKIGGHISKRRSTKKEGEKLMNYRQEDITIPGTRWNDNEETVVTAQVANGSGLCYHSVGGDPTYGWTITHLASKKALSTPMGTEYEVKLLLEKVIGIADWTQSEKELIKPEIAIEFKKCQQTVRQELNQQLESALRASAMPEYLVEETINSLHDEEYVILRNALLYIFKIAS